MGRKVFRNYYKGHMDKTKGEGGSKGGRWVWLGWARGSGGEKMQTNVIEQQFKKKESGAQRRSLCWRYEASLYGVLSIQST